MEIPLNKNEAEEGIINIQEPINIFIQGQYLNKKNPIIVQLVKH